jgi:hypothetical protein
MIARVPLALIVQVSLSAQSAQSSQLHAECPDGQAQPFGQFPTSERPHRTTSAALCVLVSSNGCTDRDSFEVAVVAGATVTRVTLTRRRPDPCRMRPHQVWLGFGWTELGLNGPCPIVVEERSPP